MAMGSGIMTWFEGTWHNGDVPIMRAADHGSWQGSNVFDGARMFDGLAPDLDRHCARINRSAAAMMITPTVATDDMVAIVREGLAAMPKREAVYIRPMYWALDGDTSGIVPKADATGFCVCLEVIRMAPPEFAATLATTRFRRPVLESSVCNAKAGALYPNNARMLVEARNKGFSQRAGRRRDGQRRRKRRPPTSSWCATARCSRRSRTAPSWPASPAPAISPTCAPTGWRCTKLC